MLMASLIGMSESTMKFRKIFFTLLTMSNMIWSKRVSLIFTFRNIGFLVEIGIQVQSWKIIVDGQTLDSK